MVWHKVLELDELADGRVKTVTVGRRTLAVTHHDGAYGVLDNRCPHQGGPLGEGSIEQSAGGGACLRCPWHGYDYHPITGQPPPPFDDAPQAFDVSTRDDGIYADLPNEQSRHRSVADVMVETMINWGVRSVFGMVGHSNLGFAQALHDAETAGRLRYFGIRHEGAAAFAASAYGKLTGELAACFAIAGPGSTNLLTGLYDAKVDRAPVLALCGQVPSKVIGRGAFQDLDLQAAFADVADYSETVLAGADYPELMSLACKTAIVQRGVGHLVFPDEVQVLATDMAAGGREGRVSSHKVFPPIDELNIATEALANAERPLIIVGAGARQDMAEIVTLAESINAPVVTTFKAKGQISDNHPLGCGVLGRSGTPVASWFMNESDLLVVFGASFSNHTGIADYKPTIQVDLDPMALGRFHAVDHPLLGDAGVTATAFARALAGGNRSSDQRQQISERWAIWRSEKESRASDASEEGIAAAAVFAALGEEIDPGAVIAVDVGNNTYSFGRYFEVQRQTVLMSGYLGSIGFALPAALGAWAAVGHNRQVVSVSGDGGFGQYAMEFTTAVKYDMNLTHVLLNNSQLGKISKEQRAGEFDVWQTSLHNPSFAEFARLCGGQGHRVTTVDELKPALRAALAHPGPALVEIIQDAALL